jgi:hypothetical protein
VPAAIGIAEFPHSPAPLTSQSAELTPAHACMRAGALNFRDVMLAYGKLSKDLMAHGKEGGQGGGDYIGLEFSGQVSEELDCTLKGCAAPTTQPALLACARETPARPSDACRRAAMLPPASSSQWQPPSRSLRTCPAALFNPAGVQGGPHPAAAGLLPHHRA